MSDVVLVYMTAPDEATAMGLARALVERRLAACANVIPGMRSVYRWKGEIEEDGEHIVIAKTRKDKAAALRDAAAALHPAETPCILTVPVDAAASAAPFIDWIAQETLGEAL